MPPNINGLLSSGNINQTNVKIDISKQLYRLWPDRTPFFQFMMMLKARHMSQPEFKWFTNDDRKRDSEVTADVNASVTTIPITDGNQFIPHEIIGVMDGTTGVMGERFRITSISGNNLTVVRGVSGTTAAAITTDEVLYNIGNAQPEGGELPESRSTSKVEHSNYCQIFRTVSERSMTLDMTGVYVEEQESRERRLEKMRAHKWDIESALIYGVKSITGAGTASPTRTTDGLLSFIDQSVDEGVDNTFAAPGGTLTEADWDNFLDTKAFAFGSKNKTLLASRKLIGVITNLVKDRVRLENKVTEYGVSIKKYMSNFGMLDIVLHEGFAHGELASGGIIIDTAQVTKKVMGGMDISYMHDVRKTGKDALSDVLRSELGLEYGNFSTLSKITNVEQAG